MKILRAISSVNSAGGGPINGLINSSRILQDRGHSVTVLSLDPIDAPWVKEFDFPIVTFAGKFASYLYVSKCAFWLKENVQQYDAVIIHGLWQYHSIATAIACAECNVPYFVFTHGMLDPWFNVGQRMKAFKKNIYWKVRENQVVNNATAVLFTSEEEKILARDVFLPYFPTERVVLYGSAAPQCTEVDAVDTFYDVYPKLKNVRFYLYLSRIHEKKGLDLLLRVIADSSVLDDDSILVIAGSGSPYYISYIKGLIVSLGIEEKVVWLGMIEGKVKWGAYYAAAVFILPSHQENFGLVVAEALSTSTAVLITNKVNIWSQIDDAGAGYVENDDFEGVSRLLGRWSALTTDQKTEMGSRAKSCYQVNFSVEAAAVDLERLLLDATSIEYGDGVG